jgi:acetyl-CoA carboxylase, biotin carboxylase subunit
MRVRRILVANRGEIAVRILRTCHRLGIEAVLAASAEDLDSPAAQLADATICIGPAEPAASYLSVRAVLDAALAVRADAIHPGYGFLAENPRLALACASAGVVFIGPPAAQLDIAGDKLKARRGALAAGVAVPPGGEVRDIAGARRLAAEIGWPVLVKAVAGGGGRGITQVRAPGELRPAIDRAIAEAAASFGDSRVYLERFVPGGRHVEVQLLGDGDRVIHLGDRDCSAQRRYAKLVEEAPAPALSDRLRAGLHDAATALGSHLRYLGAGTVEFLVDCAREEFYFLEINARIQVEHPVTEAVCGIDLVAEQITLAEGHRLRLAQGDVTVHGHAIECRINAEDPARGFRPDPGTVTEAVFPAGDGIRVDTHLQAGTRVPPFYDPLLAKLIAHGSDRAQALARLRHALARCQISGVTTTLAMHAALARTAEFSQGGFDTGWFSRYAENQGRGAAAGQRSGTTGGVDG